MNWKIEYNNDTGPKDESFREWWTISDGRNSYESDNEEGAKMLCDILNNAFEKSEPSFTSSQILQAAKEGEVSMVDAKHIVEILEGK
jgi:hypothetical protein